MRGVAVTECVVDQSTETPQYNATFGFCERMNFEVVTLMIEYCNFHNFTANAPILREGKNGPFLLHSYDPSTFVIHVGTTKEVTLKSYYYLAIYVQSPGLNGVKNTVSFRVQGPDGRYIKASDSSVYTDNFALNTSAERDRATFWLRNDRFHEVNTLSFKF